MIPTQTAELAWLKQTFHDLPGAAAALEDGFLGSVFEHYRRPVETLRDLGMQTVTPEILWETLDDTGRQMLGNLGHGVPFLKELAAVAPTPDELRYSGHQLRQRRIREIVASGITTLTSALYAQDTSGETLLKTLFSLAEEAQKIASGGDKEYLLGEEIADYALFQLTEIYAQGGVMPSGIPELDKLLAGGGFRPGQAVAIGAWPAHGKSLLASAIAEGMARQNGVMAYFIDAEMGVPATVGRIVQRATGRGLGSFRDLESELEFLTPQLSLVSGTPLVVGSPRKVTLQAVLRHSQMAVNLGCKVIVWDGVTIIKNTSKGGTRQEEIESITREAKAFAREYGVVVLFTGQLNQDRPPQNGLLRPPEREDFKGSRSFTEDADYCFLARRVDKKPCAGDEELYGVQADQMREKLSGTTWVKMAKDRHGGNEGEVFDLHLDSKSLRYLEEAPVN